MNLPYGFILTNVLTQSSEKIYPNLKKYVYYLLEIRGIERNIYNI